MKRIILFFIGVAVIASFVEINALNYKKTKEIQASFIKHPENLPTKEIAKNTALGFKNLRADLYWLQTIQYIGGNAIGSDYKKYLYTILDLITELNPYFEHPYTIGQLLLPSYNYRYEDLSEAQQDNYTKQGEALGLKGIENFCDKEKIGHIKAEFNLQKIWTEEKYKNPCKSFSIPYYLAYIYHYYKNEPLKAANYYKIASANEESLEGAKVMAAIMQGKGGQREKSYFMFLNIAKYIESEDQTCNEFSSILENIGAQVFIQKSLPLSAELIKSIGEERNHLFGNFDPEKEDEILSDTKCINYVNKAVREINLAYIEEANERYEAEQGEPSFHAKELFDKGYLEYLPQDFQQYETYGIIYEYNNDTGNYDYSMGNYD